MPFFQRLSLAREAGLSLPDGPVALWGVTPQTTVPDGPFQIISRDARVHDRFPDARETPDGAVAGVVIVPREKRRAQDWMAEAAALGGHVIVDGQKTDGIEPMLKALKKRGLVEGPVSKAHGKLFWMDTAPDLSDWRASEVLVDGMHSWPGVFSADRVDAGSRLLVDALPTRIGTSVVDLGAGWGWLSAQLDAPVIHMVETDGYALDCACKNVPAATAHWADVLTWHTPQLFDACVMNPPFHEGRKGVPDLGRAFITKSAQVLKPAGRLFMVANRHLPYEETLAEHYGHVTELAGDGRFKVLQADRPKRHGSRRGARG